MQGISKRSTIAQGKDPGHRVAQHALARPILHMSKSVNA